jgi:hypothetical protein
MLVLHFQFFNNGKMYDIKTGMMELTSEQAVVLCGDDACQWVDYSAPGNIMYGCLSGLAGMPQNISWLAGGIRESLDNKSINWEYRESVFDRPEDKAAVDFGYQLARDNPDGLTIEKFKSALSVDVLNSLQPPTSYPSSVPLPQQSTYPPGYFLNPAP